MTVPTRTEAAAILRRLDPPAWFLRHSCAVAEIAAFLARGAAARGRDVDRSLVEAAALLHDVDKLVARAGARPRPHGDASAAWLTAAGHPELAAAVAGHPVTRLADDATADTWLRTASLEERIVAYADKRAGQRLEPMDARFAGWRRRYPATFDRPTRPGHPSGVARPEAHPRASDPTAEDAPPTGAGWDGTTVAAVLRRARRLEDDVCAACGIHPADVRRLRWTSRALRTAEGTAG